MAQSARIKSFWLSEQGFKAISKNIPHSGAIYTSENRPLGQYDIAAWEASPWFANSRIHFEFSTLLVRTPSELDFDAYQKVLNRFKKALSQEFGPEYNAEFITKRMRGEIAPTGLAISRLPDGFVSGQVQQVQKSSCLPIILSLIVYFCFAYGVIAIGRLLF